MAGRLMFSEHPSNPLEVPTSDPQNARYRRQLQLIKEQRRLQATGQAMSSSDPIAGYHVPEVADYRRHIQALFPEMAVGDGVQREGQGQRQGSFKRTVEEIPIYSGSDDELEIVPAENAVLMEVKPLVEEENGEPQLGDVVAEDGREQPLMVDMQQGLLADEGEEVEGSDEMVESDLEEDFDDETDEELSLILKSPEEREEIEDEIAELEDVVPQLAEDYKLVDRLGTGTFSSVYKAVDLHFHSKWYNGVWQGPSPSSSGSTSSSKHDEPKPRKTFVAIKRIYVTSNPERIRNEIAILEDCRGCRHTSQLITAFRHRDQVVAIMPYHRNDDFRDFFRVLPMDGVKAYFRCLLRALRDIHSRGIIHRDVKPANFLFDRRTSVGTLCDFGLACRVDFNAKSGHCLHTPPSREHIHGQKKSSKFIDIETVKSAQRATRQKSAMPSDRVGYPEKDLRPVSKANRAGTRGFRAPEVLLKCNEQTGAIDIWSVGMIMLFFLTGKFPLFQSNDDIEALMEIACIIGKRRMELAATLHCRTFATNVPSITREGITWREFVEKNNPELFNITSPPGSPSASPRSSPIPSDANRDLELAVDLLEKLLIPESIHRITARDALYHPFLAESEACAPDDDVQTSDTARLGDDAFFPHPPGEGLCAKYHEADIYLTEHRVSIPRPGANGQTEVRVVQAGEGLAIGFRACEFHAHLEEFRDEEAEQQEVDAGNIREGNKVNEDDRDDLSEEL